MTTDQWFGVFCDCMAIAWALVSLEPRAKYPWTLRGLALGHAIGGLVVLKDVTS